MEFVRWKKTDCEFELLSCSRCLDLLIPLLRSSIVYRDYSPALCIGSYYTFVDFVCLVVFVSKKKGFLPESKNLDHDTRIRNFFLKILLRSTLSFSSRGIATTGASMVASTLLLDAPVRITSLHTSLVSLSSFSRKYILQGIVSPKFCSQCSLFQEMGYFSNKTSNNTRNEENSILYRECL